MGAICFTSSGSNGGCWVVLVFPRLFFFFFWKNGFFFAIRDEHQKIKFPSKKKRDLRQKKKQSYATYAKKNKKATYAHFHNRPTLFLDDLVHLWQQTPRIRILIANDGPMN